MLKEINGGVTAPRGYKAAGVKAGIKKSGREDLALIASEVPATAAAVFTQNVMAAAPVLVSRRVAAKGQMAAAVINSGCANACTGGQGIMDAEAMAHYTASLLGVDDDEVMVASTGIIGIRLPIDKIRTGIQQAVANLAADGSAAAAQAIITTDTFPKSCAYEFTLGGSVVRIGGLAKGSGMIHPNMATMLAFITTDAAITVPVLKAALTAAVDVSFHMITVDGDTSTNDMVSVMANGLAGNQVIDSPAGEDFAAFVTALQAVCVYLAKQVARDGEGATKFLEIKVSGAVDAADAKKVAMTVAKSPLVKTAFFGQDPNWGRIVCAVGYAEATVVPEKIAVAVNGQPIVQNGLGATGDEASLRAAMAEHDITVKIDLGLGAGEATVWTCDLSYEYVKINGEYHT